MEKAYLDKIKEAEETAQKIVKDSKRKSDAILYEAQKDMAIKEKDFIEKTQSKYDQILNEARESAKAQVEKADKEYEAESKALKAQASTNIDKAADYIVEKVIK